MLIYALGGGWGHLTRAVSLARACGGGRVLSNSPHAPVVRAAMPEIEIVEGYSLFEDDLLVVDTFPRGIMGELAAVLPLFRGRKVLVHRDLNPKYIESRGLREFVAAHYDVVLRPGERELAPLADLPQVRTTRPWLIRSARELPSRDEARRRMGVGSDPCVLVIAGGYARELEWYGQVEAALAGVAVRRAEGWPAMDLLPGADCVIGGAGYNTVNECAACGVPLVARAWPRKYDRQRERTEAHGVTLIDEVREAPAAVERALEAPRGPIEFVNGAEEAAAILQNWK